MKFNKRTHKYIHNGEVYDNVTSWIKKFFVPFDTKEISKIVALNRRRNGEKITALQVRKEWKQIAKEGSLVHKEIEKYIKTKDLSIVRVFNDKSKQAVKAFHKIIEQIQDIHSVTPEQIIYDEDFKLAGTTDLIIIHRKKDEQKFYVSLIDWKTNKNIKEKGEIKGTSKSTMTLDDTNYIHYALQLTTYALMIEKNKNLIIDNLYLVHLKENSFEIKQIKYEDFKKVVIEMLKEDGKW